jgi:hypothetical protein
VPQTNAAPSPGNGVIIIPPRPEVFVLPRVSDPYRQLPSLAISALALVVSIYALRKTLSQKRNEHRAHFFHEVAVGKAIDPLVEFFEELTNFCNEQRERLSPSPNSNTDDNEVRQAMRHVRDLKRATATRICGLVSPFSANLEEKIQAQFDNAEDQAIEYLAIYASGAKSDESISRSLYICQRSMIELFREHEFRLGWPRWRPGHRVMRWLRSTDKNAPEA